MLCSVAVLRRTHDIGHALERAPVTIVGPVAMNVSLVTKEVPVGDVCSTVMGCHIETDRRAATLQLASPVGASLSISTAIPAAALSVVTVGVLAASRNINGF